MLAGVSSKTHTFSRNEVILRKDGIIFKAYRGHQNAATVRKLGKKTERLIAKLRDKNKRVFILMDLSHLGETTVSARNEEIMLVRALDFDKAAVFGQNPFNLKIATLIVTFSGMGYKIRFFDTQEQAEEWLIESY